MTCNFTSFLTVLQSYQDDERLKMKAMCNGALFTVEKISLLWESLYYKLEWLFIYTIKNCVMLRSSVHMS